MSTPSRQHINVLDPLKYGFKSLTALPYTALKFFGLFILTDIANSGILTALFQKYTSSTTPVPFFAIPSGLNVSVYFGATPIGPLGTIFQWLNTHLVHAPWYALTAFALAFIFLRTILYAVLINIALHWHDTETAITEKFIPTPYSVIWLMLLTTIASLIIQSLPGIMAPYTGMQTALLILALMFILLIYIALRYCFLFYYMIDTKSSLTTALKNVENVIWRINLFPLFVATGLPSLCFLYHSYLRTLPVLEPGYILSLELPITYWVSTFALVYIYRKLFFAQEISY